MPEISVIIPLYNKGRFIRRAVTSVLNQSYHSFEIIVIDDGSADDGADQVREFAHSRITLIQQQNSGVSAARNLGIQVAGGQLVAFLDADDEWRPDFLRSIIELRAAYPHAGIYGTAFEMRYPDGKNITQEVSKELLPAENGIINNYFRAVRNGYGILSASSVCIPKEIFQEIGLFKEGCRLGEDTDMWARIALKYPVAFSSDVQAIYWRDDKAAAVYSLAPDELPPIVDSINQAMVCAMIPSEYIPDVLEYTARLCFGAATKNVLAGRMELARRMLSVMPSSEQLRLQKYFWYTASYLPFFVIKFLKQAKKGCKALIW